MVRNLFLLYGGSFAFAAAFITAVACSYIRAKRNRVSITQIRYEHSIWYAGRDSFAFSSGNGRKQRCGSVEPSPLTRPPACQILNLRVLKTKKNEHPKVFDLGAWSMLDFGPHPYRMRPEIKGLSHGLKKCPPDTFLPRFARPSFRVPKTKKERTPEGVRSGTPEGTRTPDLLIRSQSLYPTELPAHVQSRLPAYINTAIRKCQALFFKFLKIFLSVDRGVSAW